MAKKITPQSQAMEAQNAAAALQQIDALNEQTAIMQQESYNKAHDPELTNMGRGNTVEETNGMITSYDVIGEEEVREAYDTLLKYKEYKSDLENKLISNERFYKLEHWNEMYRDAGKTMDDGRIKPRSGWLFNTVINKHADAMDNYPEANILPRAKDDEGTAKALSKIIPVIMDQNNYEQVFSDTQWYKMKNGTCVTGIFWDNEKNGGMGDIAIKEVSLMSLYWKSGITDIQDSPNVFQVQMMDNDDIKERYGIETGYRYNILPIEATPAYSTTEKVDTSDQSAVVDWYYKKRIQTTDDLGIPKTRTVLHYCKFCNGQVIYASENDPQFADEGWLASGQYPFVFDVLYPVENSICGMGIVDVVKDEQLYIDKLQQAILENAISNARPRWAIRNDGSINEKEFMDISQPIVHSEGNLGEDSFRQIVANPLSSIYETVYLQKVQEMKDTSGNTAVSQGQATNVSSASGIASQQEAAGKLSRDSIKSTYRAYRLIVNQVIELMRQFYNQPRCFRILGDNGQPEFVNFDNAGLLPQSQGQAFGIDLGSRMPIMDIDVKPQKKSAYSKESQNQTALNLYNMGFFAPNNADASLACLEMMEFDNVEKVRERVQQNGTLYQQVLMLQQQMMQLGAIVDAQNGTNLTQQMAGQTQQTVQKGQDTEKKVGISTSKGSLSSQAASTTRNSTAPR